MKNIFYLFLAALLTTGITACDKTDGGDDNGGDFNEGGVLTLNLSKDGEAHSIEYIYTGDARGEMSFSSNVGWRSPDDLYAVEIVNVGRVNGIGKIGSIPDQGWTSNSVACEVGCGYIIRITGYNSQDAKYVDGTYMYARLYVEEAIVSTLGGIMGAKVKLQYPWKMSGIKTKPDEQPGDESKYKWTKLASAGAMIESSAFTSVIGDDIYVVNGTQLWVYSISDNSWTQKEYVPKTPYFSFVRDGKLYAGGASELYIYDSALNTWSNAGTFRFDDWGWRLDYAQAIVSDNVYTVSRNGTYSFDFENLAWNRVGDGIDIRRQQNKTVVGNKVYAISSGNNILMECDPSSPNWVNKITLNDIFGYNDKNIFYLSPYIYIYSYGIAYIYNISSNTYEGVDLNWPYAYEASSMLVTHGGNLYTILRNTEMWKMSIEE